ncbi:MAG: hypothetical protein ACXWXS_07765, partial [Actinomycetota bacterium]
GLRTRLLRALRVARHLCPEHLLHATQGLGLVDDDDAPDEAEALRRVQEMLGATPVGEVEE